MLTCIDFEGELADALGIAAPPVPAEMPDSLPYACAVALGGTSRNNVDAATIDVDVWAEDAASAMDEARALIARARALEGTTTGGATWGAVRVTTLPYGNPDPRQPRLSRATFTISATAHAVEL